MSARSDGGVGGLMGNHVPHRHLPTVDEEELPDEDSPETSSTPPDDVTAMEEVPDVDMGGPEVVDEDDVDEPRAMSSSEVTLSDQEPGKDQEGPPVNVLALPNGPTAVVQRPPPQTGTEG